jgi:hypothetical protein
MSYICYTTILNNCPWVFILSIHSQHTVMQMVPVHTGWGHFCKFHTAEWCYHILHGWTTQFIYFFCDTETAVSQYPLLGLSCSSITTVATSVTLLLAMLLLTLLSSTHVWKKSFSSRNANVAAQCWRPSLNMAQQQCAVANLKLTCSKLCSICNTIKRWYRC